MLQERTMYAHNKACVGFPPVRHEKIHSIKVIIFVVLKDRCVPRGAQKDKVDIRGGARMFLQRHSRVLVLSQEEISVV